MTPAQALTAIQTMADHSQKWHDGSSSRNIESRIAAKRWVDRLPLGIIDSWDLLKKAFIQRYCPPSKTAKQLKKFATSSRKETRHYTKRGSDIMTYYINAPLMTSIAIKRQTDNNAKHVKELVENKHRTKEDEEIIMNPRCSALLQNHLPPKEQDPGSFILPCSIGKLDFHNALADLGAKDFVILDMIKDLKMPIILGRPLLATAHAKEDIFKKSIYVEVRNEKVIFKMRSSFTKTDFESVRSIKSKTCLEDDDFRKIDFDLFLYDFDHHLKKKMVHWCKADLQEKENERQYWASCNPNSNVCDGGDLPINVEKHYWESNNDSKREELEWENLSLNDWMRIR
nr:hypothetical protein [Tanacetum cinerariifolium]